MEKEQAITAIELTPTLSNDPTGEVTPAVIAAADQVKPKKPKAKKVGDKAPRRKLSKVHTISSIRKRNAKKLAFEGTLKDAFGLPEHNATFAIWGTTGAGKSSLIMQLAREFIRLGHRVCFNSIEMGTSSCLVEMGDREGVNKGFNIVDGDTMEEALVRMKRKKSPKVLIIDSLNMFRKDNGKYLTKADFEDFVKELKNKVLIFIIQAEGKEPKGVFLRYVAHACFCKAHVKKHKAFVISRFKQKDEEEVKPYIIWYKRSQDAWGDFE